MRKIAQAFVIGSAMALAACGSETSGTFTNEDGDEGSYSFENEDGEFSANVTDGDTRLSINAGGDNAVDLPYGFTIYPGAKVLGNISIDQADGEAAILTMTTTESAKNVANHYKREANAAGITIKEEMNRDEMSILSGESAEGVGFNLSASPTGDGLTSVSLMIGSDID